jgi:hypothetical protein
VAAALVVEIPPATNEKSGKYRVEQHFYFSALPQDAMVRRGGATLG